MDAALDHHKVNSFLLCLLGLTAKARDPMHVPGSKVVFFKPLVRRRVPHIVAVTLLANALIFQSYIIYGIVINRDLTHAGSLDEALLMGEYFQKGAAGALLLCAL